MAAQAPAHVTHQPKLKKMVPSWPNSSCRAAQEATTHTSGTPGGRQSKVYAGPLWWCGSCGQGCALRSTDLVLVRADAHSRLADAEGRKHSKVELGGE